MAGQKDDYTKKQNQGDQGTGVKDTGSLENTDDSGTLGGQASTVMGETKSEGVANDADFDEM